MAVISRNTNIDCVTIDVTQIGMSRVRAVERLLKATERLGDKGEWFFVVIKHRRIYLVGSTGKEISMMDLKVLEGLRLL